MKVLGILIQTVGEIIHEVNKIFYFPLKLDTHLPWGVFVLMYVMYRQLKEYMKDEKLTSFEFLKLIGIYLLFLGGIIASYTDFDKLMNRAVTSTKSLMAMVVVLGFVSITIGIIGAIGDAKKKTKWILTALYFPIVLLMLTNGNILTQGPGIFKSFMPRFKIPFVAENSTKANSPSYCCQYLQPNEIEEIIKKHAAVEDIGIIVYKDTRDKYQFYKSRAFVVLKSEYKVESKSDLKDSIRRIVRQKYFDEIKKYKEQIEYYKIPCEIEFVDEIPKRDILEKEWDETQKRREELEKDN